MMKEVSIGLSVCGTVGVKVVILWNSMIVVVGNLFSNAMS
jgi:hypothetical protein